MSEKLRLFGITCMLLLILLCGCISSEKNEWALKMIQIDKLHELGFTGKGVTIGLIDTGLDLRKGDFDENKFIAWKDLINGREEFYDDNGHGTFIAGLLFSRSGILGGIRGICPDCNVVVVKAVSEIGESNDSIISDAIDFCVKNGVDIILLSLYKNQESIEMGERSIEKCREAIEKGIIVVAPAGDDGMSDDGDVFDLAGIDEVISVGSVSRDYYISPFSSKGNQAEIPGEHGERFDPNKKPEIVAPGEGIESIGKGGFVKRSGTSISASFVAGAIALLLEGYPELKGRIDLIKDVIATTAMKIPSEDIYSGEELKHNDRYGYGLIKVYDAYKKLGEMI